MENENARGHLVRIDDGTFVERDVLGVIQRIMDYDPNLKVQYLEYAANMNEAPWRILEKCYDGKWRVVMYVWELNDTVLHRIWKADNQKGNVGLAIEQNNAKVRSNQKRRYREEMEEANDIVSTYLGSRLGRWTVKDQTTGKFIKLDDDPTKKAVVKEID